MRWLRSYYEFYKRHKKTNLTEREYRDILYRINEKISEEILKGNTFQIPYNYGFLYFVKFKSTKKYPIFYKLSTEGVLEYKTLTPKKVLWDSTSAFIKNKFKYQFLFASKNKKRLHEFELYYSYYKQFKK